MDSTMMMSMETSMMSCSLGVTQADKLRLASCKGQLDKVKELLMTGATYEPDREGRTALHYAALGGHSECVSLLLAQGCDINIQDNLGYTSLHRAAGQGHLEVIEVLLQEGCHVDKQDEVHGNTALHEAAWNGFSQTLEMLLKAKAKVSLLNRAGFSALHLAAQNGHNQCARLLLYANCGADTKNSYGDSPLHTAARYGHAGVSRILISAKCRVSEQNKNGDTALHIASALKRRKIAKLLMDASIDTTLRNKQQETAADVAKRKEHLEILDVITSQPSKGSKKKKHKFGKKKDDKSGLESGTESERKSDKKGFFFRKKAKKDKNRDKDKPSVMSTGTSAVAYHDKMAPEQLLHGFQKHQKALQAQGKGLSSKQVHGLLNKYVQKDGVQYYRDLAGNVRQGPIGFAPVCNCGPTLNKMEKKMEADCANLYDRIDTAQQMLTQRIDDLDRRTNQQYYALDKLTRERLEAERKEREHCVHTTALQQRLDGDRQLDIQQDLVKTELKAYIDMRVSQCSSKRLPQPYNLQQAQQQYEALQRKSFRHKKHHDHGRLFRTRSDETLSSCNRSRKSHRVKVEAEINPVGVTGQTSLDDNHISLPSRDTPPGGLEVPGMKISSGRSPDGTSGTEGGSFQEGGPRSRNFQFQEEFSNLRLVDEEQLQNLSDSLLISRSEPHLEAQTRLSLPAEYHTSTPQYGSPQYMAPNPSPVQMLLHHSTGDTGSNPDSGYSSKGMCIRPMSGNSHASSTSHHLGPHDISLVTNSSSNTEEGLHTARGEVSSQPVSVTRHFFDTVSNQMEKWYERRLVEVENKTEQKMRHQTQIMQNRLHQIESKLEISPHSTEV